MDIQRRLVSFKTMVSWKSIPHVAYNYEPDVTEFFKVYHEIKASRKRTLNTLMLKAVTEALKKCPSLNASCTFDQSTYDGTITLHEDINIDIPWILPDGNMITLTLYQAQHQSLDELTVSVDKLRNRLDHTDIEALYKAIATRLRHHEDIPLPEGSLTPRDVASGTITVSNIGSICRSSGNFTLLDVLAPQVCAIGISAVQERPGVYADDQGEIKCSPCQGQF